MNCQELTDQIEEYKPYNEQEEKDKRLILDWIRNNENAFSRENAVAHMTASAWVVNRERTKVLMVYHNIYNSWSWLGGHADGEKDLLSVAVREVKEEAGLNVKAIRVIAIQDRNLHNIPPYAYNVCKVFVLCEIESGSFRPNIETDESAYFGLEELPIPAKEKNNEEQIKMCFSAYYDRNWQVLFD